MSGQDANAMSRVDQSVEVAELSPSRLNDLVPLTTYSNPVKSLSQIAKEGFPKFMQLPFELRSMIWKEAMPPYGFFTVLMLGREEPMPQQPPAPAPMRFRAVYRLEPVPRDQQDDKLRTRLETMRAIQRVSTEAASEVEIAFPTTIDCTGGKLRFNAVHDTLGLSDLPCHLARGFLKRFARYSRGAIVFQDNWHKIPQAMLFDNEMLWSFFNILDPLPWGPPGSSALPGLEGFMTFLADCDNLRVTGFMYDAACEYSFHLNEPYLTILGTQYNFPECCRIAPIMRGSFYERYWRGPGPAWPIHMMIAGSKGLEAFIGGLPPGEQVPGWAQSMRFGRPELQHLRIQAAVPVSPWLLAWRFSEIIDVL